MKLALIAEVWHMMKESVIATDRDTVSENLVSILIDNDHSAAEIRSAFREDSDVIAALKYHVDDALEFEENEDVDYEDFDEYIEDEDDEEY